jgi:hypothetical protein
MTEFNFTYQTCEDQYEAERTGYIESYDCVRVEVRHPEGGIIDFPVKSRESYMKTVEAYGERLVKTYPTVHSYDLQDYL